MKRFFPTAPLAVLLAVPAGSAAQEASADGALEVSVREIWRTKGDPGFGRIGGMAAWPNGTVWVGGQRLAEVSEISADGTAARVVLREGEGPGEVGNVYKIAALPQGGVLIKHRRGYDFFRPDKRLRLRVRLDSSFGSHGLMGTPDGGFIVSSGHADPSHRFAGYSVHRFDSRGRHVRSWHPVADHDDWETVQRASGGPVAPTRDGGMLVSDAAPFRITRYSDLRGGDPRLVVEDESVVPSSEMDRIVTRGPGPTTRYTTAWSRSFFVHEMENGNILNMVRVWPEDVDEGPKTLWVVVSPNGEILARTLMERGYRVWSDTPDGHYLASYGDGLYSYVAKLEVTISPRP